MTSPDIASTNVLVVIPTFNEERHIEACIRSLMGQGEKAFQMVVADGMSQDRTVEIVRNLQPDFPSLRLIENPKRLQSAAVNLAAEQFADFENGVLVRCDAHSLYPPNFIHDVVSSLVEEGASSLVIPMDAVGHTCFEKANAWIVDTPLGSGGAAHRGGGVSGYIDHGHHAGFDISWFRKVGGYDESFSHNEDAEYDHRLALAGGTVFLDADIRIGYVPRGSLSSLSRQYFNYGKGRARTCLKHRKMLKLRQLLPIILVFVLSLGVPFSLVHWIFALPIVLYGMILVLVSAGISLKKRSACGIWSGPVLASMHIGWGAGFIVQVLRARRAAV